MTVHPVPPPTETGPVLFRDRAEAGRALAAKLAPLITPPCVVAGIPRGGVAVALPVAERLRAPLTVVYARKLTARSRPSSPSAPSTRTAGPSSTRPSSRCSG